MIARNVCIVGDMVPELEAQGCVLPKPPVDATAEVANGRPTAATPLGRAKDRDAEKHKLVNLATRGVASKVIGRIRRTNPRLGDVPVCICSLSPYAKSLV
jgi:hypothetical protein